MNDSLDNSYFQWLYSLIGVTSNPNPERSHYQLIEQMHRKVYRWFVPHDDNRACDGMELQQEFAGMFLTEEPSLLEIFVALCRRLEFETDIGVDVWFWHLMDNLGLRKYNDEVYDRSSFYEIDHIFNVFINREYDRDGHGGIFPLEHASQDQRRIELWDQMSLYLLEGHGP